MYATKLAIATLGRRVLAKPDVYGVGINTAAILLVAAGDNPPSSIAVPRDRRAMESDMREAQISEEGVDLRL